MIAALHDYRNIWRVTTTQRDPGTTTLLRAAALLLVLCAAGFMVWTIARHRLDLPVMLRVFLGIGMLWLAIVWAFLFVPGSVLLNSAANARLLPRQRRRVLQMAALGWLATTLGFTAALGMWAALPLAGLYMLGFAWMRAGNMRALGLIVIAGNWPWMSRRVLPPALVETLSSDAGLAGVTLALLALAAFALRWMYPAGGDVHLDTRSEQVQRMLRMNRNGWVGQTAEGRWSLGGVQLYAAALRRDCRRSDPATLLMHALGPVVHWTAWISAVAVMLAIGVVMRLLMTRAVGTGTDDFVKGLSSGGMASLVFLVLFSTAQYGQQIHKTHGEQALLRLTPLAGAIGPLNRRVAGKLLRRALLNWALLTLTVLGVSALIGGDEEAFVRQFALCCLAGQAAMFGLLGDYAGTGGWSLGLGLWTGFLAVVQAAVAVGLGWWTGSPPWAWMIMIAVAVGAWRLRRDWQRMLAAPPAFPAGRMA